MHHVYQPVPAILCEVIYEVTPLSLLCVTRVVVTWDVSKGDLGAPLQRMPLLTAQQQPGASIGPSIVALASCDGTQLYAAGEVGQRDS
jgi:hypothetical protein